MAKYGWSILKNDTYSSLHQSSNRLGYIPDLKLQVSKNPGEPLHNYCLSVARPFISAANEDVERLSFFAPCNLHQCLSKRLLY